MAAPESLLVERPTDDLVVFRINRPEVRNALNLRRCACGLPTRLRVAAPTTKSAA